MIGGFLVGGSEEDGLEEMFVGLMEKFAFSPTSYDMISYAFLNAIKQRDRED